MPPDLSPIMDIKLAADRAISFVQGTDRDSFLLDERTRWAVYSQIVLFGRLRTVFPRTSNASMRSFRGDK